LKVSLERLFPCPKANVCPNPEEKTLPIFINKNIFLELNKRFIYLYWKEEVYALIHMILAECIHHQKAFDLAY
jgi:hypothetical protein